MAKDQDGSAASMLLMVKEETGLSWERFGELYRAVTGSNTHSKTIESWCKGKTEPTLSEYHYLVFVLQQEREKRGLPPAPLPIIGTYKRSGRSKKLTWVFPGGSSNQMSYFGLERLRSEMSDSPGLMSRAAGSWPITLEPQDRLAA